MDKAYILIIDDHKMVRESLVQVLKMFFSDVRGISNPNQLNSLIAEKEPDVILLDMNFSAGINTGNEGIFWLKEIKKQSAGIQVITITAYGEIDLAVRAIKEGAHYFIQKPWENELLIKTVNTALELRRKSLEVDLLSKQRNDLIEMVNRDYEPMIGNSGPMLKIKEIAAKVAVTDANILITGENGTGKGLLARYIHSLSERKESPFISVDLGSIPESLFESELFGHKKGAFTDAREDRSGRIQTANAGTLFLDEIANIPVYLQSKLLNVVQERKVTPLGSNKEIETDIRLICATNRDLKQMVTDNLFREDLFFRINTIELKIPALRERMDDVPLLTDYYLEYYYNKYGK